MGELRNVIVFAASGTRYALELRWVREVVSLGFVTGVPTAPPALCGVCNLHGSILPVLDVAALLDLTAGPPARQGDGALVLETEGVVCALRVDQVDHVATLPEGSNGGLVDAGGRALKLLDPAVLVRRAQEILTAADTAAGEGPHA
ncbi:MAG TPA: chemotaxis protein CheW [Kofleriaceae bacterium]